MKCTVCGSEINPGDKFCMACGTSVESMGLKAAAPESVAAAAAASSADAVSNVTASLSQPVAPAAEQAQTQSTAQPVAQPAYAQPQPAYAQPQTVYAQPQSASFNDRVNQDVAASNDATPILALGIVALATALSFYFSIAGIICGAIGLSKANAFYGKYGMFSAKANTGRNLAKAGLIVGIVMTSLFALFILVLIGEA